MDWTNIVQAATQAAGPLANIATGIVPAVSRANVAERKILREDINALKRGQLGLSEAEKNQQAAQAAESARAAQAPIIDEIQRQAAASGGASAASYRALGDLGKSAANSGAQARSAANIASTQLANQRRDAVLARISRKAEQNREGAKYYGQKWEQSFTESGKALGGGGGGSSGGGGGGGMDVSSLMGGFK